MKYILFTEQYILFLDKEIDGFVKKYKVKWFFDL